MTVVSILLRGRLVGLASRPTNLNNRLLNYSSSTAIISSSFKITSTTTTSIRNPIVNPREVVKTNRRHYHYHVQRQMPLPLPSPPSSLQRLWYTSTTTFAVPNRSTSLTTTTTRSSSTTSTAAAEEDNDTKHIQQQQYYEYDSYSFNSRTIMIPHDSKKHRGGEDAVATNDHCLVIADGVGGWTSQGINPANFSRRLVQTVLDKVTTTRRRTGTTSSSLSSTTSPPPLNLAELLQQANLETAEQYLGSATCTLLTIGTSPTPPTPPPSSTNTTTNATTTEQQQQQQHQETTHTLSLNTVSVGDSGYAIFRRCIPSKANNDDDDNENKNNDSSSSSSSSSKSKKFQLEYVSKVGQKEFNFPYQLGGIQYGDDARKVAMKEIHQFPLELFNEDDNDESVLNDYVIVVYTDGVSDNLQPKDFITCLEAFWPTNKASKTKTNDNDKHKKDDEEEEKHEEEADDHLLLVADCIARMSYFLGKSPVYDSPFSQGARLAGWGKKYKGGKQDDITVTVAQLVRSSSSSSSSITKEEDDNDKKSSTTIFTYTGDVPSFDSKH